MILNDATSEIYYARLTEEESTITVIAGLKEVIEDKGAFCAWYSESGKPFLAHAEAREGKSIPIA